MRAVVLGAGPAGSTCAVRLLRSGFEVALLESEKFPRNMPGETLHPGIESLLKELEVFNEVEAKNFHRHRGIWIGGQAGKKFEFYNRELDWKGFQLYRKDFDEILLQKALSLGVDYFEEIKPRKIIKDNNRVTAIATDQGEMRGDFFIDATGRKAWLARQLKIKYRPYSPKLIVYYGYVAARAADDFREPQLIWDQDGWIWIARINENIICWNCLNLRGNRRLPGDWLPEELKTFRLLQPSKAVDVTWKLGETLATGNCFLLGDSAFVLDPLSSRGVIKAVMSGMMLAHLLKAVSQQHLSELNLCLQYQTWLASWFFEETGALRRIYAANGFGPEIFCPARFD